MLLAGTNCSREKAKWLPSQREADRARGEENSSCHTKNKKVRGKKYFKRGKRFKENEIMKQKREEEDSRRIENIGVIRVTEILNKNVNVKSYWKVLQFLLYLTLVPYKYFNIFIMYTVNGGAFKTTSNWFFFLWNIVREINVKKQRIIDPYKNYISCEAF